ncbi:DoxX family protein [Microbacterium sp. bgisy203]|uniref:DoxX family protein n=1 Tax=Microbacterium sp. bgisy203 TaxID=3413799 RepID=UPI003D7431F1
MLIALWIVNIILALLMLGAGLTKALRSKEQLAADPKMAWTEDFSPVQIRLIGIAEFLGALGLILPLATGIAPILTPIAAVGLAILMIGAVVVHIRRGEKPGPSLLLAMLAVASAVLGFLVVLS